MNWLPVSKVLLTLLSLVLALVGIEELLVGPSSSTLSWQVVSGGISSGWTLVLPQLVFCFSQKSMLIGGTDMLYAESGEERSISQANEAYWSSAQWSKSQFWSEVHRFAGHHKSVPAPIVDGVSGLENIANLWCNFKWLYDTVDGSASKDLLSALDSGISYDVLDRISILVEVIEVAMKHGKSDGDSLMSICQF